MIAGTEKPDTGTFKVGKTVKLGYVEKSVIAYMIKKQYGKKFIDGYG